jgi:hypothetical protein
MGIVPPPSTTKQYCMTNNCGDNFLFQTTIRQTNCLQIQLYSIVRYLIYFIFQLSRSIKYVIIGKILRPK